MSRIAVVPGSFDPVTLGLCTQIDLDFEVNRASKDRPAVVAPDIGATLIPAEMTTAAEAPKKKVELDAEHFHDA